MSGEPPYQIVAPRLFKAVPEKNRLIEFWLLVNTKCRIMEIYNTLKLPSFGSKCGLRKLSKALSFFNMKVINLYIFILIVKSPLISQINLSFYIGLEIAQ